MGLRASEASYGARRPAPAYQARWAIRIPSPRRTARAGDCSGEDALPEEARDEHGELMGALRVGIVPGPLDHRDAAESGGHLGDDPLGLSPGVGPVGVLGAHDDQGRAGDAGQRGARVGESAVQAARREVNEETGVDVEITGLSGIYSDPQHVIAYDDGEVRQEFSLCFHAKPVGGELRSSSESKEARWVSPDSLQDLKIHPS